MFQDAHGTPCRGTIEANAPGKPEISQPHYAKLGLNAGGGSARLQPARLTATRENVVMRE